MAILMCASPRCGKEFVSTHHRAKYCCKLCKNYEFKRSHLEGNRKLVNEKRKLYYERNRKRILEQQKLYAERHKERNKEYLRLWCQRNKEHILLYRERNKEHIHERDKLWRERSREHIRLYYQQNKERIREYTKLYKEQNRDQYHAYNVMWRLNNAEAYQEQKERSVQNQKKVQERNALIVETAEDIGMGPGPLKRGERTADRNRHFVQMLEDLGIPITTWIEDLLQ